MQIRHSALLITACVLGVAPAHRTAAQTTTIPQGFDVASIHVNQTATDGHHHIYNDPSESRFRTVNVSVRELIQYAWNLPGSQVLGGPSWLGSTMFDIDARSDAAADAALHQLSPFDARDRKARMLQELLIDRFRLRIHQETQQLALYKLILAKGGPRFQPAAVEGTTIDTGPTHMHVAGSDDTVSILAAQLARELGRVVLNETGLKNRYDIHLQWTPEAAVAAAAPDAPPNLFTAVQEQLGLKLESSRGPVPVLVIDSVEPPTAN